MESKERYMRAVFLGYRLRWEINFKGRTKNLARYCFIHILWKLLRLSVVFDLLNQCAISRKFLGRLWTSRRYSRWTEIDAAGVCIQHKS